MPPALLHRYASLLCLNLLPTHHLDRYVDPLLGVFTGVFAYYLHETHPRTAPPPGQRLTELLEWKRDEMQRKRGERLAALEQQ